MTVHRCRIRMTRCLAPPVCLSVRPGPQPFDLGTERPTVHKLHRATETPVLLGGTLGYVRPQPHWHAASAQQINKLFRPACSGTVGRAEKSSSVGEKDWLPAWREGRATSTAARQGSLPGCECPLDYKYTNDRAPAGGQGGAPIGAYFSSGVRKGSLLIKEVAVTTVPNSSHESWQSSLRRPETHAGMGESRERRA